MRGRIWGPRRSPEPLGSRCPAPQDGLPAGDGHRRGLICDRMPVERSGRSDKGEESGCLGWKLCLWAQAPPAGPLPPPLLRGGRARLGGLLSEVVLLAMDVEV